MNTKYRKIEQEYLGLNFSNIPINNVRIEGEYFHGDVLKPANIDLEPDTILLYVKDDYTVALYKGDSNLYVTKEDLKNIVFTRYD